MYRSVLVWTHLGIETWFESRVISIKIVKGLLNLQFYFRNSTDMIHDGPMYITTLVIMYDGLIRRIEQSTQS